MSWWEILAVFGGIPIAVSLGIGALVYLLTESRVPDGLAAAAASEEEADPGDAGEPEEPAEDGGDGP